MPPDPCAAKQAAEGLGVTSEAPIKALILAERPELTLDSPKYTQSALQISRERGLEGMGRLPMLQAASALESRFPECVPQTVSGQGYSSREEFRDPTLLVTLLGTALSSGSNYPPAS